MKASGIILFVLLFFTGVVTAQSGKVIVIKEMLRPVLEEVMPFSSAALFPTDDFVYIASEEAMILSPRSSLSFLVKDNLKKDIFLKAYESRGGYAMIKDYENGILRGALLHFNFKSTN